MNRQAITRMRGRTGRYAGMAAGFAYWRSRLSALIVASGMVLAVGLFASPAAAVTASITLKPSAGPLTSTVTPNIAAPPDVIVSEADGHVNLPVTLSASSTQTVTVSYATANSTAGSGTVCNATYTGVPGPLTTTPTLTFTPGQTLQFRSEERRVGKEWSNLSAPTNANIMRTSRRIGLVCDPT